MNGVVNEILPEIFVFAFTLSCAFESEICFFFSNFKLTNDVVTRVLISGVDSSIHCICYKSKSI